MRTIHIDRTRVQFEEIEGKRPQPCICTYLIQRLANNGAGR